MTADLDSPGTGSPDGVRATPGRGGLLASVGPLLRDQRVRYLIVGGINTGFAFVVFASLQLWVGHTIGYMGVLLVTHVLGVLEAFTLSRTFVFQVKGSVLLDLARFETVNLGALAVNAALLPLFVEVVGLTPILAQVVVLFVVTIGTFLGHKHFSFFRRQDAV